MNSEEFENMARLETQHWWYKTLHQRIHYVLRNKSKSSTIIDAGCGTGGLMMHLQDHGFLEIKGFDLSHFAVNKCLERHQHVIHGNMNFMGDMFEKNSTDIIICNDALYFLDNKEQLDFITNAYSILRKSGLLIINIPAFQLFKGNHDQLVGIRHRITFGEMKSLINHTSFNIQEYTYWPFFLSPLIYFYRKKYFLKSKQKIGASDLFKINPLLNSLLYICNRIEHHLIRKGPIGSSLFIVLSK